jgi:hypothetical protein
MAKKMNKYKSGRKMKKYYGSETLVKELADVRYRTRVGIASVF